MPFLTVPYMVGGDKLPYVSDGGFIEVRSSLGV